MFFHHFWQRLWKYVIKSFSQRSHLFQTGEEKTNKTTNMSFPEVKKSPLSGFGLNMNVNVGHFQTMKPRKRSLTSLTTKFTPFFFLKKRKVLSSIFTGLHQDLHILSCQHPSSRYFSIVFHPLCDTRTRLISLAGQIFLRSVRDGLNLSQSSRRNKQKPKTEDRGQLCLWWAEQAENNSNGQSKGPPGSKRHVPD